MECISNQDFNMNSVIKDKVNQQKVLDLYNYLRLTFALAASAAPTNVR